jgi:hypothetical protein
MYHEGALTARRMSAEAAGKRDFRPEIVWNEL